MNLKKIRTVPACKMCLVSVKFQTCVVTRKDGSKMVLENVRSPTFRGELIPYSDNSEAQYISGCYVKRIVGDDEYLYCCVPSKYDAIKRASEFGFTYFRFFPDGSSECRDADGQLWKFSKDFHEICVCEEEEEQEQEDYYDDYEDEEEEEYHVQRKWAAYAWEGHVRQMTIGHPIH